MNTPTVIGLDLSLRSTGVSNGAWCARIPGAGTGHDRLAYVLSEIAHYIQGADLCVIEGLAFKSFDAGSERAGLQWLVRHMLWRRMTPYAIATPQAVKTYATGRGNAQKDEVLSATIRRFPDVQIHGNDEADALNLALLGLDHLGHAATAMPETHRRALTKIQWPNLGAAA